MSAKRAQEFAWWVDDDTGRRWGFEGGVWAYGVSVDFRHRSGWWKFGAEGRAGGVAYVTCVMAWLRGGVYGRGGPSPRQPRSAAPSLCPWDLCDLRLVAT